MTLKLDKNWSIEPDTRSWNLRYEYLTGKMSEKTGEPTTGEDLTFHARLKDALLYYLNESLKPAILIPEVLARIAEAEKNITTACAGITKDAAEKLEDINER